MLSSPFSAMSRLGRLIALTSALIAPIAGASAQGTGTIRGRVTDAATARAIPDAQITITGTQLSASTTAAGDYTITNVPAGTREAVVRRLGYTRQAKPVTVTTGGETRLDVTLAVTASTLEAIVVTGTAGATEKRTIGNAVAQIDVSDLPTKSNVTNITDVLQARAPGVQIEAGSGTVGAASDIRIRGAGSFSVTQPIIYIDGVRMSGAGLGNFDPSGQGLAGNSGGQGANALDLLNPSDVESIEVVRGPAAATLYGADAANGVIQVITKKGARGQQNVQWSGRVDYGANDLGSVEFPNNYTTCDATKQAAKQTDGTPLWPGCQGVPVNTILTEKAPIVSDPNASHDGAWRRYSLNARGGGDRFNYYISGDHSFEKACYSTTLISAIRCVRTSHTRPTVARTSNYRSRRWMRDSVNRSTANRRRACCSAAIASAPVLQPCSPDRPCRAGRSSRRTSRTSTTMRRIPTARRSAPPSAISRRAGSITGSPPVSIGRTDSRRCSRRPIRPRSLATISVSPRSARRERRSTRSTTTAASTTASARPGRR